MCFPLFDTDQNEIKAWFGEYLHWMNSMNMTKEKFHLTTMGVLVPADRSLLDLVDDQKMLQWVRQRSRPPILPG